MQIYVDDVLIFAKNEKVLNEIISLIESIYEVKNLGPLSTLLELILK